MTTARIARLWWPLAMSWLMMGIELPLVTHIIAGLPEEEANLSALSSLVYPIALLVEAPIIMLLAASTTLVKDWETYRKLRRFTHVSGFLLTLVHVVIAFSPVYDWIARDLIEVDASVVEPGRLGLQWMTPWTWAIASRRFQQGVLIRFERSRDVVMGTGVRLMTVTATLYLCRSVGGMSGIAIGAAAIAGGVVAEAVYASIRTRFVLHEHVRPAPPPPDPLTWSSFARFYVPLAMTPFMTIILQSVGAAAMNRMPEKILSTATWSAVYGLVFLFRTAGFAFNEVVVTLIADEDGVKKLRQVAWLSAAGMTLMIAAFAMTPLGPFWFGTVINLPPHLAAVASDALGYAVWMPGYAILQSYYQGALVHSRRTRGVTEAVAIYLLISTATLALGIYASSTRGIVFVLCAFTAAGILQTLWLRFRSLPVLRQLSVEEEVTNRSEDPRSTGPRG